jgi:hypothetical protein
MSYVPATFTAGFALVLTAAGAVGGQWVADTRQAMRESPGVEAGDRRAGTAARPTPAMTTAGARSAAVPRMAPDRDADVVDIHERAPSTLKSTVDVSKTGSSNPKGLLSAEPKDGRTLQQSADTPGVSDRASTPKLHRSGLPEEASSKTQPLSRDNEKSRKDAVHASGANGHS